MEAEPKEDPLAQYRRILIAGVQVKTWSKGSPCEQRLLVSEQWTALILKDVGKNSKNGVKINLRSIDKVLQGHGEGHLKKSSFGAPSCKEPVDICIRLTERVKAGEVQKELAAFSFSTKDDCALWLAALSRLLQTSKLWTHRLKDGEGK